MPKKNYHDLKHADLTKVQGPLLYPLSGGDIIPLALTQAEEIIFIDMYNFYDKGDRPKGVNEKFITDILNGLQGFNGKDSWDKLPLSFPYLGEMADDQSSYDLTGVYFMLLRADILPYSHWLTRTDLGDIGICHILLTRIKHHLCKYPDDPVKGINVTEIIPDYVHKITFVDHQDVLRKVYYVNHGLGKDDRTNPGRQWIRKTFPKFGSMMLKGCPYSTGSACAENYAKLHTICQSICNLLGESITDRNFRIITDQDCDEEMSLFNSESWKYLNLSDVSFGYGKNLYVYDGNALC